MSIFNKMGGFIGYIMGAVIILPLLLIAYNYFFINKNAAEKYLLGYMANGVEIKLQIPEANDVSSFIESKIYTTSMQTKNMGRDGSKKTTMNYRVVNDNVSHKYFQIIMFDLYNGFFGAIDNNTIYAKVNKDDLSSSKYGTKDRPILVFSVRGAGKPLTELKATDKDLGGSNVNIDTNPEQYKYNAIMYLTYVMPKSEFKERFEK